MRPFAHYARSLVLSSLVTFVTASSAAVLAQNQDSGTVWATPHDSYSSSVGVLGCKVDTNRIAYWPGSIDCNHICVSLNYGGRSVKLLRVDSSQGAHDVSYDAWNYLITGYSATKKPTAGGPVAMEFAYLDPSECSSLIHTDGHKLPLSASNSMNFLAECLGQPDSFVAKNHVLYNVLDAICSWGFDEECELDWPNANQPTCPHALGDPIPLASDPVYNIRYPSGDKVLASTGQVVSDGPGPGGNTDEDPEGSGAILLMPGLSEPPAVAALISLGLFHLLIY